MPRGPLHPGRAAGAALPRRPGLAGRAGLRLDGRLPRRHVPPGGGGDRPAPPRQRRRALRRGAGHAARGVGQPGNDARVAGRGPGGAPGRARQGAGPPAGHPGVCRRPRHPLHDRDPGRHRRRPQRPAGRAEGHRSLPRPPRARAGGHRPELPAQAGHGHGQGGSLPGRGPAVGHCGRPPGAPARRPRAGAAEPLRPVGPAAPCRHRRLGRRVAGHVRPREPRAGLAGARRPARGHRGGRPHPRTPHDHLPDLRPRPRALARPGAALRCARRVRRRGVGPRRDVVLGGRGAPAPTARPDRTAQCRGRRWRGGRGAGRRGAGPGGGRGGDRDAVRRAAGPRCAWWPRSPTTYAARSPATP